LFSALLFSPFSRCCLLNDLGSGMPAPSTIFHSVISFMTNTDLQHYSEINISPTLARSFWFNKLLLSASIGFCGLTAIIRLYEVIRITWGTSSSICGE
jgi:K+-transporting ATPase A subunit